MNDGILAGLIVGAYLLGSVPFGLLVGWFFGAGDVRTRGSGNIGATNVLRTAGKMAGFLALVLDMAKGGVAVGLVLFLFPDRAGWTLAVALAVFVGHLFPLYLRFKGGKGVATALGIFLAWTPLVGVLCAVTWLITAKIAKISSLAALVAFLFLPLFLFFLGTPESFWASLVISPVVFLKHRGNIQRLFQGTEPRIGEKVRQP